LISNCFQHQVCRNLATLYKMAIHRNIFYPLLLGFFFSCKPKQKDNDNNSNISVIAKAIPTVISQNAKHLKRGAELEITVQTESLSDTTNPRVTINGIAIAINPDSLTSTAIYVTKVHGALGEHIIPVTVTHNSQGKEIKVDSFIVSYFIDN